MYLFRAISIYFFLQQLLTNFFFIKIWIYKKHYMIFFYVLKLNIAITSKYYISTLTHFFFGINIWMWYS